MENELEPQIKQRSPQERDTYLYNGIRSGNISIRNFQLSMAVERTRVEISAFNAAIEAAVGALPEKIDFEWADTPNYNSYADEAKKNIEGLKK